MDKDFIKQVRKEVDFSLRHHCKHLMDEDGSICEYHEEKLKIYTFLERVLNSVLKPLERFIPEKQGE